MARTTWKIDVSHSELGFWVRHLMVSKVRGSFTGYTAEASVEGEDFTTAQVKVEVDVASINTRDEKRDGHLKSPDFFDVANHPKMTFVSTGVTKNGEKYALAGHLTIHGVTKPVTLDAEFLGKAKDPWGNTHLAFGTRVVINRKDFGLGWNAPLEAGGVLVGEDVTIEGEVQFVPA